jgi:hypothetical protein
MPASRSFAHSNQSSLHLAYVAGRPPRGVVGLQSLDTLIPHLNDVIFDGRYCLGIAEQ